MDVFINKSLFNYEYLHNIIERLGYILTMF